MRALIALSLQSKLHTNMCRTHLLSVFFQHPGYSCVQAFKLHLVVAYPVIYIRDIILHRVNDESNP